MPCGLCEECLDCELVFLSLLEFELWLKSAGDVTRYLNLMAGWVDLFNKEKGVLR